MVSYEERRRWVPIWRKGTYTNLVRNKEEKIKMIKKFFPGANSSRGFYSLYDYILPHPCLKLILKGGPGVGKSTFIRRIAQEFWQEGWEVEHHCCSSDNHSLDGAVIQKRVAIIDGTAPHTVDPVHPGVVDDIINLGEYWQEEKLEKHREEIIGLGKQISQYFKRAYLLLQEVGILYHRLGEYYQENWKVEEEREILSSLKEEIFSRNRNSRSQNPQERHLFASAITPDGVINHLPTLLSQMKTIYLLTAGMPAAQDRIVKNIKEEAVNRGFETLILHCGLLPENYHHLILEENQTALITETSLLQAPSLPQQVKRCIPLHHCHHGDLGIEGVFGEVQVEIQQKLKKACQEIRKARDLHHQREEFYIEAMDFQQMDSCTKKTLERMRSSLRAI